LPSGPLPLPCQPEEVLGLPLFHLQIPLGCLELGAHLGDSLESWWCLCLCYHGKTLFKNFSGDKGKETYLFFYVVFVFGKWFLKNHFLNFFCVCLLLEKLVNGKYFLVKGKFGLISRKVFSFYFGWKTFSGSCKKFRNIILFSDYITFGSQTYDYYIFFVLNICFLISSLRI